jgi:AcrR family transcriptional regulator
MSPVQKRIHAAALRLFVEKNVGDVNVSELAQIAGVTRPTIYNNLKSVESLFEDVASHLSAEMNDRVGRSATPDMDPAQRMANGIRFYVRRAHEETNWGGFIVRYATSTGTLQEMWKGAPMIDVLGGLAAKRFNFRQDQLAGVMGMIGGTVLSAMVLVLDGHRGWRDAGSDAAEMVLRALGVPPDEALAFASRELPVLPPPLD